MRHVPGLYNCLGLETLIIVTAPYGEGVGHVVGANDAVVPGGSRKGRLAMTLWNTAKLLTVVDGLCFEVLVEAFFVFGAGIFSAIGAVNRVVAFCSLERSRAAAPWYTAELLMVLALCGSPVGIRVPAKALLVVRTLVCASIRALDVVVPLGAGQRVPIGTSTARDPAELKLRGALRSRVGAKALLVVHAIPCVAREIIILARNLVVM